ncbi:MAG: YjgP/YjgQ family permease [Flavobacteriaceae bacterium]|nr:LptF/LptG family permease [Bacteroidia bacterium]NNL61759.1 YjgP/YjgQ family permease [Flavobacteriaceae bacterium]
MKILDRYILTSYLKTFISVFIILMLIFVLQSIWLYIKELAGKDLDIAVIGKFILYITPTLVPLILPLTILLTSIMVFGNFAENYEFAAMKSTGISLQRAMKSLSVFIVLLGITTFFFSNNVIPWAQYNSYNLRKNIAKLKPALAIAEGQFNQIGSMNIKVAEKSGDRGQYLKEVVIHKLSSSGPGNFTTIVSETGELISNKDSDVLKLVLFDGNYYDEIQSKDYKERRKKPFVKSEFEEYTINVDLAEINENVDLEQKQVTSKYDMLNVKDLDYTIDSLKIRETENLGEFSQNLYQRTKSQTFARDSLLPVKKLAETSDYQDLFDTDEKLRMVDMAINKVLSTNQILQSKEKELFTKKKWLNKHIIVFHEKFALGFACIILFFVGAPLGALIKKGGLGLPMVIAIVLFLVYHFIGIFAKNSAEDSSLNPMLSSWLSTIIMLPVSIYLTSRATKDRGLFDVDLLLQPIVNLFKPKEEIVVFEDSQRSITQEELDKFGAYENSRLIDIIQNYRKYDYNETYRDNAFKILNERGISEQELKIAGHISNDRFENAKRNYLDFTLNSRISLFFYIPFLIGILAYFVLNNNNLPLMAIVALVIAIPSTIMFLVFLSKAYMSQTNFYKIAEKKYSFNIIMFIVVGIPLYFLLHVFNKKKMKEELKVIQ